MRGGRRGPPAGVGRPGDRGRRRRIRHLRGHGGIGEGRGRRRRKSPPWMGNGGERRSEGFFQGGLSKMKTYTGEEGGSFVIFNYTGFRSMSLMGREKPK